jgi:hypothetical protein
MTELIDDPDPKDERIDHEEYDAWYQEVYDELTVEYEDMAPSAQRIVDAEPVETLPQGLTREQMLLWITERFAQ